MADWKLTLPMTIDEIRALADRLEARGTSVLMRDQISIPAPSMR
jgi:hypothetical protein